MDLKGPRAICLDKRGRCEAQMGWEYGVGAYYPGTSYKMECESLTMVTVP